MHVGVLLWQHCWLQAPMIQGDLQKSEEYQMKLTNLDAW